MSDYVYFINLILLTFIIIVLTKDNQQNNSLSQREGIISFYKINNTDGDLTLYAKLLLQYFFFWKNCPWYCYIYSQKWPLRMRLNSKDMWKLRSIARSADRSGKLTSLKFMTVSIDRIVYKDNKKSVVSSEEFIRVLHVHDSNLTY